MKIIIIIKINFQVYLSIINFNKSIIIYVFNNNNLNHYKKIINIMINHLNVYWIKTIMNNNSLNKT